MVPLKSFFVLLLAVSALSIALGQAAPNAPSQSGHPVPAAPDFTEVRRLLQQGQFDEAIRELRQIEKANPQATGLDHELGAAYYKKGDYIEACGR